MGCFGSTPKAPSPTKTAAAQAQANIQTAAAQARLNNVNQSNPLYSVNYTTDAGPEYNMDAYNAAMDAYNKAVAARSAGAGGMAQGPITDTTSFLRMMSQQDGSGNPTYADLPKMPTLDQFRNPVTVPQYTQTVSLNPTVQATLDRQLSSNLALAGAEGDRVNQIGQQGAFTFDPNADLKSVEDALYRRSAGYLDPEWQGRERTLDAKLANQGIVQGSQAWADALGSFGRQRAFDYSQARDAAITGAGAEQSRLFGLRSAARLMPYEELGRIRSLSAVNVPNNPGTASTPMAGTDIAGLINGSYNQQVAANNASKSGLYSLGGTLGSALLTAPMASAAGAAGASTLGGTIASSLAGWL